MKRLLKTYETVSNGTIEDSLYLVAANIEDAMLTGGGVPGVDYTFKDLYSMAVTLMPHMFPEMGDMSHACGYPPNHRHSK